MKSIDIDALLEPKVGARTLVEHARAYLCELSTPFLDAVGRRETAGLPLCLTFRLAGAPVLILGTWRRALPGQKLIANAALDGNLVKRLKPEHFLVCEQFERDASWSCTLYAVRAESVHLVRGFGHYAFGPAACELFWRVADGELVPISGDAYDVALALGSEDVGG